MSRPDLSTLPARMRYAAQVLEEASERYYGKKTFHGWAADGLRNVAAIFDDQDRAAKESEQQVEELAKTMFDGVANHVSTFEWGDYQNRWNRDIYRHAARAALDAGWTKAPL
jgi:hypothetical protein